MLWTLLNGGFTSIYEVLFMLAAYGVLLLIMLPAHEAAHAWAAVKLGDPTAKLCGRLTMNPLAHLDPIGSAMLVLCGIGYAKPVPVNPRNFKNERRGMALTALAGPVSNLLMALVSVALFWVVALATGGGLYVQGSTIYYSSNVMIYAYYVLIQVFASVNLSLAVFNLLPLPPLDGSRIFGALLPPKWTWWMDQYHEYVRIAVLLLVFSGALNVPLNFLTGLIGGAMCALFGLPNLL